MNQKSVGRVEAIAVRTAHLGPMRELSTINAITDGGLEGDRKSKTDRGVTLLSLEAWEQVVHELGVELPWHSRRANVLVSGLDLGQLIGRRIQIGDVSVTIADETRPCGLMDKISPGLRKVLAPDCRAGVHGHITAGGSFRVGDLIQVLD